MPNYSTSSATTYPNQRMVNVHRETPRSNFLGIKNENWQAASRDLGPHALRLYLYLAANADNYTFALSPEAIRQAIGTPRSTYHDQFKKLVEKGYLVQSNGNTFEFYERPQFEKRTQPGVGLNFDECPSHDIHICSDDQPHPSLDREINNKYPINNTGINNRIDSGAVIIQKPEIEEIVIPHPVATGECRPQPKKEAFEF